ncbi:MAG: glycosyltransferase family 39 protein [Bacteroidia bacterium]|nr:glycosyltransferase family 39 protein [Bacteroidia bacterium]
MLRSHWKILLVVGVITFVPLFVNLGTYPLQIWDEARNATNSYEMYKDHDYLVPKFQGYSELWNTKPPLLLWLQSTSMHLFGVSEFSVRLPSALSGLLIYLLIAIGLGRLGFGNMATLIAILLLVISPGFTGFHCLRTGDYEALLVLFLLIQIFTFYFYVNTEGEAHRRFYLHILLIAVILGVLTKGVNSLLFLPALAVMWFLKKMWLKETLWLFIIKVVFTISLCLSYYIVRESFDPGYIHWVKQNELGGRFLEVIDNNAQPWDFYLKLFPKQLGNWVYLILPSVILGFTLGTSKQRQWVFYLVSNSVFFLVVISIAQTKTIWYNVPLIPLFAIVTAIGIEVTVRRLLRLVPRATERLEQLTWAVLICVSFGWSYVRVVRETITMTEEVKNHEEYYVVTNFLRDQLDNSNKHNWVFIDTEYSAHNWWYIERLNDSGHHIESFNKTELLESGMTVLLYEGKVEQYVKENYHYEELVTKTPMKLINILALKPRNDTHI